MQRFITGSQMAHALAVRHTLERARTRWPECTGALMYKLNDNYPAASWATTDWYGATKIAHWFVQDAFSPLHACAIFDSVNNNGKALSLPVFLLDDADAVASASWKVNVRAFDGKLKLIKAESFNGTGSIQSPRKLGTFDLTERQTDTTPLLVVTEVMKSNQIVDRTFYFVNYEPVKDCLLTLPRTQLKMTISDKKVIVTNTGKVLAVGVHVDRPGHADTFRADDNYFWLDVGESKTITVNDAGGLAVGAWNAD